MVYLLISKILWNRDGSPHYVQDVLKQGWQTSYSSRSWQSWHWSASLGTLSTEKGPRLPEIWSFVSNGKCRWRLPWYSSSFLQLTTNNSAIPPITTRSFHGSTKLSWLTWSIRTHLPPSPADQGGLIQVVGFKVLKHLNEDEDNQQILHGTAIEQWIRKGL